MDSSINGPTAILYPNWNILFQQNVFQVYLVSTGSPLTQVMASRLFGAKLLLEPMLTYHLLVSYEQTWMKCEYTCFFLSIECIWKCRQQNVMFPCISVLRQQALMARVSIFHLCIKYALYRSCWHALSQRFHASLMMNWLAMRLVDWLIVDTK